MPGTVLSPGIKKKRGRKGAHPWLRGGEQGYSLKNTVYFVLLINIILFTIHLLLPIPVDFRVLEEETDMRAVSYNVL